MSNPSCDLVALLMIQALEVLLSVKRRREENGSFFIASGIMLPWWPKSLGPVLHFQRHWWWWYCWSLPLLCMWLLEVPPEAKRVQVSTFFVEGRVRAVNCKCVPLYEVNNGAMSQEHCQLLNNTILYSRTCSLGHKTKTYLVIVGFCQSLTGS